MKRSITIRLEEDDDTGLVSVTGAIDPPLLTDGTQKSLAVIIMNAVALRIEDASRNITMNGQLREPGDRSPIERFLVSGFADIKKGK